MEPSQALTDITQAKAMGLDAFALNIISLEYWSTQAVQFLFDAAAQIGFQLFFSFDMTHFTLPAQFFPLLLLWTTSAQYYHFNGLPFVSTLSSNAFLIPTELLFCSAANVPQVHSTVVYKLSAKLPPTLAGNPTFETISLLLVYKSISCPHFPTLQSILHQCTTTSLQLTDS